MEEQWKELNINSVTFEYNAGGDSIYSGDWVVTDKNRNVIELPNDLMDKIENEAYDRCEIYGDSSGDYIGAYGHITVTYNEEEGRLEYNNEGSNFYNDWELENIQIKLTNEAAQFIRDKVKHIHYPYEFAMSIEYIEDCFLTEEEMQIIKSIEDVVTDFTNNYRVEGYNVTETISIDFSTNKRALSQNSTYLDDLKLVDNILYGYVNANYEYSY